MQSVAMQTRMGSCSVRPARCAVVVRAQAELPSRRAALGLFAGVVSAGALLLAPKEASAFKLPSQEFTGGMVTGGGSSPKSGTAASMEGYIMEGTRKSGITATKKAKLLAKLRASAEKVSKQ